jgi:hypothetical protein
MVPLSPMVHFQTAPKHLSEKIYNSLQVGNESDPKICKRNYRPKSIKSLYFWAYFSKPWFTFTKVGW